MSVRVYPSFTYISQLHVYHNFIYITASCISQLHVYHSYMYITASCISQLYVYHSFTYITATCISQLHVYHSFTYITASCISQLHLYHSFNHSLTHISQFLHVPREPIQYSFIFASNERHSESNQCKLKRYSRYNSTGWNRSFRSVTSFVYWRYEIKNRFQVFYGHCMKYYEKKSYQELSVFQ